MTETILIIVHQAHSTTGRVGHWLKHNGYTLDIRCPAIGTPLPQNLASYAGVIVFGGPKQCYALVNAAEYWAEGVQDWYDTNRTMDHDHNHIHTREQLKAYDPGLAKLCKDVLGDSEWRFTSPRLRAGKDINASCPGRLPALSPKPKVLPRSRRGRFCRRRVHSHDQPASMQPWRSVQPAAPSHLFWQSP